MRVALAALLAFVVVGAAAAQSHTTRATVYAAASLTDAFPAIAPQAHFSFAGSNALAAQIRQGAPADVFASANMKIPLGLYGDGFCSKPAVFTRNALVLIVPRKNRKHIDGVGDLKRKGIKLVIAAKGVPVGDYTLQVLEKLKNPAGALELLREAFDMLEEDFEEERFFAHVRRTYWQAPAGSPTRKTAEALIQKLEF